VGLDDDWRIRWLSQLLGLFDLRLHQYSGLRRLGASTIGSSADPSRRAKNRFGMGSGRIGAVVAIEARLRVKWPPDAHDPRKNARQPRCSPRLPRPPIFTRKTIILFIPTIKRTDFVSYG